LSKFKTFGELQTARRNYIVSARENDFEDGLRTLLAELYPDNAHFIYELLQNAEDARATEVRFNLFKDRLEVAHNGKREFTLGDVKAITGIGQSMKKDDPTQIGKFGVGFKAVFTYTNHPEVHSGNFSFVINDLFVPEETSPSHVKGETKFVFPFDRTEKNVATSYKEIARGLNEIGGSTLLFLSSVSMVKFEIEGGETGSVSRDDLETPRILIQETKGGEEKSSYWLRLLDHPEGFDEKITVAAAFSLHDSSGKGSTSNGVSKLRVQPVAAGDTCIYFPAVKETSGLRFHIHAPFASTVARDSVRDDPGNAELVAAIGALIVRELPALRDQGLLDDGLLSALPNIDDVLVAPYSEIRRAVYVAFNETALTPVFGGGGFLPAQQLIQSPTEFRAGLVEADLEILLEIHGEKPTFDPHWMAPKTGKAGQFLKGLTTRQFGWLELGEIFDNVEAEYSESEWIDEEDAETLTLLSLWQNWLCSKSDIQLLGFYILVGFGFLEEHFDTSFTLPIIRVNNEDEIRHVCGQDVYLPADKSDTGSHRVLVSLSYFDDDESSKSSNSLAAFYKSFQVQRWDDRADVKSRLKTYQSGGFPNEIDHLLDLQVFVKYLMNNPNDLWLFKHSRFLIGENSEGVKTWVGAQTLVIDSPYEVTGLALLPQFQYRLWSGYKGKIDLVAEFAHKIGAKREFVFEEVAPYSNREFRWDWTRYNKESHLGTRTDWDLPEFESICDTNNPILLRALWDFVCNKRPTIMEAVYQANGGSQVHRFTSQIGQKLSETEWVLDRQGYPQAPRSMTLEELAEDWPKPPPNSLASALGFGEELRKKDAAIHEKRKQAESLGLLPELVAAMQDLSPEEQAEAARDFREKKRAPSFPGEISNNPDRRTIVSSEDGGNAPGKTKVVKPRSVSDGQDVKIKKEAKLYLRQKYTADEKMYCQACHDSATFKVKGDWFFEAVEFVPNRKQLLTENYLALCPLCAAKYLYARDPEDDEALLAKVLEWKIDDGAPVVSFALALAGKRVNLNFTQTHAISLKAKLTVAGETRD
jgi:hypothetical protein